MSEIELTCGGDRLRVATLGAEARSWRAGGVDLLWPGDPAIWPEIAPILFPVVGWTRDGARVAGRRYDLGLHGFARRLTFEVARAEADFVRLEARDDDATRAIYPFAFTFAVEHRLAPGAWEIALEIVNAGDAPMPYACGLHPGFNWPFGGAPREGARGDVCGGGAGRRSRDCAGRPDRGDAAADPRAGRQGSAALRRAVRQRRACVSSTPPAARCGSSRLTAPRSRSTSAISRISPFGPNPPHRSSASKPGPATAIPPGSTANSSQKPGMRTLAPGERARHLADVPFPSRLKRLP